MANQEHIEQLTQGSDSWNKWREENSQVQPDLSGANLNRANLNRANLNRANLNRANLSETNLSETNLSEADLSETDMYDAKLIGAKLIGAKLHKAFLRWTNLNNADLNKADLSETDLIEASLIGTNLNEANLNEANLNRANLSGAYLSGADLNEARLGGTTFAKIDLRTTKRLTTIIHERPSHIELFSVQLPQDGSALHFLRGVGVPDEWINDYRTHTMHPIQYHSCFISYSSKDELLASRLQADLQAQGVRCWFAPEDMKIGDTIRQRIDEAIHLQDKLLLLLSEQSLASTWVRDEVETAFEKEQRQGREVLFPIRLDSTVMQTAQAWAATLRRTRHIGDFSQWTDPQAYQKAFRRLLRDLKEE